MVEGFETHKMEGGRVLVVLHPVCAITRDEILGLLAELGIEEAAVTFLLPTDVAEFCTDIGDMPVLIPIDQANCDAGDLDVAGRQCGQAGGRVIVMFGDGFLYEGLHPIADKYGTQCGWSVSQLEGCINDHEAATPRNSGGTVVIRPKSEQVKC